MNDVETQFNALYQKTSAFYENAMNGDKTHPFVLFKIKQLKLKKSNFKKVKEIDNQLLADALRTILFEDLNTFVADVKEYEMKMKELKASKAKRGSKPPRQNNNSNRKPQQRTQRPNNTTQRQTQFNSQPTRNPQYQPTNKPVEPVPEKLESPHIEVKKEQQVVQTKKAKSNEKYLRMMSRINSNDNKKKKKGGR